MMTSVTEVAWSYSPFFPANALSVIIFLSLVMAELTNLPINSIYLISPLFDIYLTSSRDATLLSLGGVCHDDDDCASFRVRVNGSERAISFSASVKVIKETTSVTLLSGNVVAS